MGKYTKTANIFYINIRENELDNCVPSCQSCNSSKAQYTLEEWYNPNNDRRGGEVFTQERLDKIIKWTTEDYKQSVNLKSL